MEGLGVRGQAAAEGAVWEPPLWGLADSGFLRTVGSHAPAPKPSRGAETSTPKPREGKGRTVGFQSSRSGALQIPGGWGGTQEGWFSYPRRGRTRPEPRKSRAWLPPSPVPPGLWPGPPRSSPSSPGQPSVRRSRIPSPHGVFRLPPEAAPERDRKFGQPPTRTPSFSLPGGAGAGQGPPCAGFRPQGWLVQLDLGHRIPRRDGKSGPLPSPTHALSPSRLLGLRSRENWVRSS